MIVMHRECRPVQLCSSLIKLHMQRNYRTERASWKRTGSKIDPCWDKEAIMIQSSKLIKIIIKLAHSKRTRNPISLSRRLLAKEMHMSSFLLKIEKCTKFIILILYKKEWRINIEPPRLAKIRLLMLS